MHMYFHVYIFSCTSCTCIHHFMYISGSSFFLGKVTALGVLCCFALLFVRPCLLLSFFLLISHLKTCIQNFMSTVLSKCCNKTVFHALPMELHRARMCTCTMYTHAHLYTCTWATCCVYSGALQCSGAVIQSQRRESGLPSRIPNPTVH